MSKCAQIKQFHKEKYTAKEIQERTGFSYAYITQKIWLFENEDRAKKTREAYRSKNKTKIAKQVKAVQKKWKKNNPEKVREHHKIGRKKNREKHGRFEVVVHQEATLRKAHNKYRPWTIEDINYLRENAATKSIREIAEDLGRTHSGVSGAGQRFAIDLRGDKMGANASKFIGRYTTT